MARTDEIQTISDLQSAYREKHPNGHFFDHDTLKFFGERLSEMRLLKSRARITSAAGIEHKCYVVSAVQRPGAPLKKRRVYHYFDMTTLEDVST